MEHNEASFFKQLLIFSAILVSSVTLAYLAQRYHSQLQTFAQKAAAAGAENGKAFGALMTEDLDPDY